MDGMNGMDGMDVAPVESTIRSLRAWENHSEAC